MTAVSLREVSRTFGKTRAVDGVDLDISGGGVVGLLGPNGSGKTTLLRMIATVLAPSSGHLEVLGRDPGDPTERTEIRRQLGYLPQQPGLYPGFTPYDLVDYVAVLKEISDPQQRRDEVRRVLDLVGLPDVMHRKIRRLSGGMRQRVAIAASLLGAPRLLVLDEPATGLDPEQRLGLRSILSDHGRAGTVVLSTHHTSEVAAFCQKVVVVVGGQIRFEGSPQQLASLAEGRVWAGQSTPRAEDRSWVMADGSVRSLGDPPAGAEILPPTIDDGYLMVTAAEALR